MGSGSCTGARAASRGLRLRLLVDANLSPRVAARLRAAGHDVIHVADCGLLAPSGDRILAAAAEDDRTIISADADFGTLLALDGHEKPSVVLLRSTICAVQPAEGVGAPASTRPASRRRRCRAAPARAGRDCRRAQRMDLAACPLRSGEHLASICCLPGHRCGRQTSGRCQRFHPGTRYHLDMI
ncbi:MAG: DUF5615 family PIN-like protein [Egibacteraceae bacterium]